MTKINVFLSAIYLIIFSFSVLGDSKKSEAQKTIEVFDGYCVQNYEDYENIKYLAQSAGFKKLDNDLTKMDPVLRKNEGSSYIIPFEGTNFVVSYVTGMSCGLIAKDIDIKNLEILLKRFYSVSLLNVEDAGVQISKMYVVQNSGVQKGAVISVV